MVASLGHIHIIKDSTTVDYFRLYLGAACENPIRLNVIVG